VENGVVAFGAIMPRSLFAATYQRLTAAIGANDETPARAIQTGVPMSRRDGVPLRSAP